MKLGEKEFMYICILILLAIAIYYIMNMPTSYANEGEVTVNESEGMMESENSMESDKNISENMVNESGDMVGSVSAQGGDGYLTNGNIYGVADSNNSNLDKTIQPSDSSCWPNSQQLNPGDLLPKDESSIWAQANPNGAGVLGDKNFLEADRHIGINTVGQTLRNANLQLRSEPPNPQVKVSPWLQTTIQPDTNRRYLEVGSCGSQGV